MKAGAVWGQGGDDRDVTACRPIRNFPKVFVKFKFVIIKDTSVNKLV